jgi:hypothetical protein
MEIVHLSFCKEILKFEYELIKTFDFLKTLLSLLLLIST